MTKDELKALLDQYLPSESNPTIYLATCDDIGPHVRPLSLVRDGLNMYFATSRNTEKISHLKSNQKVEFACLLEEADMLGSLRVAGTVTEVSGLPLHEAWARAKGYDASLHFPDGLDDPDLIAFHIHATRVKLRLPGKQEIDVKADLFR